MPDGRPSLPGRARRRRTATMVLSTVLMLAAGLGTAGPVNAETIPQAGPNATAAVGQEEKDLRTECAAHPEANTRKGWVKSRFETCVHQPVTLKLMDKECRLRGELWFDLWILGFSYDGSRRVDYTSSIENIRTKAVAGENPATWKIEQNFSHTINASASGPNPQMNKPAVTNRSENIAQWTAKPFWQLNYTSPDTGKLDPANAQIVTGMVSLDMRVSSPTAVPWTDPVMAYSSVRFDYTGRAAGKYKGAVFTEARVELVMSLKDPSVDQSARHILDAQQLPERTFPSWAARRCPDRRNPCTAASTRPSRTRTGTSRSGSAGKCGVTTAGPPGVRRISLRLNLRRLDEGRQPLLGRPHRRRRQRKRRPADTEGV